MPPPERHMTRWQTAVVWEVAQLADNNGESMVYEPREIPVRWENCNTEIPDANSNRVKVDVVAFVNEDLDVGGMMYLGTIATLPTTYEVKRIVKFDATQDVKCRDYQRCAYLTKQSHSLPKIVGTGS